jgi:hypothetical protein
MGQIQDLEQRITAAFARITAGVEALAAEAAVMPQAMAVPMVDAGVPGEFDAMLQEAALREADLQGQVDVLTRHLDAQGLDVQRLSSTVATLHEDLRRLREAALQGVVDPGLINKAMMAELEAMRTMRGAEANEMSDIMTALTGVLETEEARAHA